MPVSRMRHGVSKSGSPTPREMTSSIPMTSSKKSRIPDGGISRTRLTIGIFMRLPPRNATA